MDDANARTRIENKRVADKDVELQVMQNKVNEEVINNEKNKKLIEELNERHKEKSNVNSQNTNENCGHDGEIRK